MLSIGAVRCVRLSVCPAASVAATRVRCGDAASVRFGPCLRYDTLVASFWRRSPSRVFIPPAAHCNGGDIMFSSGPSASACVCSRKCRARRSSTGQPLNSLLNARDAVLARVLAMALCLSVSVSATSRCSVETAERIWLAFWHGSLLRPILHYVV